MKSNSKPLAFTSRALFTIVGGAVLVNPVYAQDQSSEELEEVVVTGLRGSLTAARDIKRDAVGVVDAISAEDIGKFPDSNLSESLQRITGVSIDRRNGEGALVTARGFGAQFNMVTLNGRMMPAADAFAGNGGTSRAFNFANLASEAITGLEVYKTSRATIATGGIGATINVKTARPLDGDAGLTANVGLKLVNDTTNRVGDDITPELSGIFNFANDAQTFGIGLSASHQKRDSGSSSSTVNDWNIKPWQANLQDNAAPAPLHQTGGVVDAVIVNAPAAGQLYGIPNDIRYHFSDRQRTRTNAQLTLQFQPSDTLQLTADYTYAENELIEDRGDQTLWMNRNGYTRIEFDTGRSVATPLVLAEDTGANKDFGYEQQHREQTNELKSVGFNADWALSDSFSLKFDIHDSSMESLPSDPVTGGGETTFSFAGRTPSFTEQVFFFNDGLPIASRIVAGNPNYTFTPAELGTQVLRVNYQDQVTDITQARLDGVLQFEDTGSLQFGIETRAMEMTQRGSDNFMTLGNWGVASVGEIPTDLLIPFSLVNEFEDFSVAGAPVGGWKGNANDLALWAMGPYGTWRDAAPNNPNDSLQYNPGFNQNNTVEEDTKAIYFQFNLKGELGSYPFNLQTGVRYEETDVTSISALLIPTAIGWEDNNDFFVQRESTFTPFAQDAEYDHVLPSFDFDIGLNDSLKARFSYSKTIARPAYNQLRSSVAVGTPQGSTISGFLPSATGSNPALVPLESDNLDLSFEYYFGESSYVSLGLFEKRVSNFIGNEVVQENLFGIRNQTGGPRAQAARTELLNRGFAVDDTRLFTMMAMMVNPGTFTDAGGTSWTGGAANYDGTEAQHLAFATRYDLLPAADDPLYTFNVTRPVNNREAKLYGAEFAGQHFFGDSGFGLQANYTIVNGDVAFDDAGDPNVTQFALLGLSDSANLVAMYEKFGLSVRLAYNWRDEFLQNNARGGFRNPEYVEAYDQIDLNVGYNFNDHLSVSLEALNLTGEDIRWHGRSTLQMWFLEDQGPRYALGARYKF
jgi:TonB-dependent receptor